MEAPKRKAAQRLHQGLEQLPGKALVYIQQTKVSIRFFNYFQAAQRTAAQKEKEVLKKAKGAAGFGLAGPGGQNLIEIEEEQSREEHQQRQRQMMMQEEYDIEQLQERERSIRQLEVPTRARTSFCCFDPHFHA